MTGYLRAFRPFAACIGVFATATAARAADEAVWHWYVGCESPKRIEMTVTLGRKQLYAATFDVCHLPRSLITPEQPERILTFNVVSSQRSLFGERRGEHLEGDVWEAGEDEDDLMLGVSFAGRQRIWCNTIHFLDPEKTSTTRLARGLTIRTRPVD